MTRPYGTIVGQVLEGNTPIFEANVSVMVDQIKYTALTATDGSYLLPKIPEGNYSVIAQKLGYSTGTVSDVLVENGNTTFVNITLSSLPARLYGVVTTTVNIGTVLVYGATVEIIETGDFATTGPQGDFVIENITVGTYTIKTTAPGYEENRTYGVVLGRGVTVRIDISLIARPGQLTGTVRDDHTAQPLAYYKVTITGPEYRETYTNELGQYAFPGLTAGNYTITVRGNTSISKYSPYIAYDIHVTSEGVTEHNIYLAPVKESLGGFVFGMDLPHSFMVLAFGIVIVILTLATYLRLKRIQQPEKAPVEEEIIEDMKEEESRIEEKEEPVE